MKKILASICLVACLTGAAQTNTNSPVLLSGPAADFISFLGTASNLIVAPYGIVTDKKDFGAGLAIAYKVSPVLVPNLRLDYLAREKTLFMPSATLTLQAPLTIAGKFTLAPFIESGVATPIGGLGANNGTPQGIFGAGLALKLSSRFDLLFDDEIWTGIKGQQFRFGFAYRF